MEKEYELDGMSMDIENNEKEKLKSVFPECFVEGKLNIDKLLNMCGEYIAPESEKYEFTWSGKFEALKLAQKRSTATLRPSIEESVNFDTTGNLYIEGDNLEVLKSLQTSYYRKVKMIYIDPPYNTGNDFVYNDDFKDPIEHYKEVTSQSTKSNPETMGRFHTNWLNMMLPRLRLAHNLLKDDGVIFISIDDHEVHNLRKLCNEIFGEENFVAQFVWQKNFAPKNDNKYISTSQEYILHYAKSKELYKRKLLPREEKHNLGYNNPDNDPRGLWTSGSMLATTFSQNGVFEIKSPTGKVSVPPTGRCWRYSKETIRKLIEENRVWFGSDGNNVPRVKRFLSDMPSGIVPQSLLKYEEVGSGQTGTSDFRKCFDNVQMFDFPKPINLIKRFVHIATANDDIILDFFSGSATTAHAVMELNKEDGGNRKFIMVQLPEVCDEKSEAFKAGYKNICEIGKERIRRAGKKLLEESNQMSLEQHENKLDIGFKVLKLDSSNFATWDPVFDQDDIEELTRRLNSVTGEAKADRTNLDIIFEVMLKLGIELTEKITKMDFDGKTAYSIGEDNLLIICLDNDISTEIVEKMSDLAPAYIVFSENSLTSLTAMSNAKLLLRDKKIDMKFV